MRPARLFQLCVYAEPKYRHRGKQSSKRIEGSKPCSTGTRIFQQFCLGRKHTYVQVQRGSIKYSDPYRLIAKRATTYAHGYLRIPRALKDMPEITKCVTRRATDARSLKL